MKNKYKNLLEDLRNTDTYSIELFTQELIGSIIRLMNIQSVSQKALARKINLSEAYVSKVLNGNANLSISSIVKFSKALDTIPHIHLAPRNKIVEWNERSISIKEITVDFGEFTEGARAYSAAGENFVFRVVQGNTAHADLFNSVGSINEAVTVVQNDCHVTH